MSDVTFTKEAIDELMYWAMHDKKTVKRINLLIKDIQRNELMDGIGKPERARFSESKQAGCASYLEYGILGLCLISLTVQA